MPSSLSPRLLEIVDALPLFEGIRIIEIGCGPGAMAREICRRIGAGHVLAVDRSAKAIEQAEKSSKEEIASGRLAFRQVAAEDFELLHGEERFDIAVAIRVGALDGRHPELAERARERIARALTSSGRLFIDGGEPLVELPLP